MAFGYDSLGLGPDFVEPLHEGVVDHKGDPNVKADSRHPRNGPLVKCPETKKIFSLNQAWGFRYNHTPGGLEGSIALFYLLRDI